VCWERDRSLWKACIEVGGKSITLGRFAHEDDAARAYDQAARVYFGDFAYTNFPLSEESSFSLNEITPQ
jgi:hypothetical protein